MAIYRQYGFVGVATSTGVTVPGILAGDRLVSITKLDNGQDFRNAFGLVSPTDNVVFQISGTDLSASTFLALVEREAA